MDAQCVGVQRRLLAVVRRLLSVPKTASDAERALALLREKDETNQLLGIIFIKSKDILSQGNGVRERLDKLRDHQDVTHALAAQGSINRATYQSHIQDLITMTQTLEQLTNYNPTPEPRAKTLSGLQKLTAAAGLISAALFGHAQETTLARTEPNPYATTETKTNTQERDYVAEFEAEYKKMPVDTSKTAQELIRATIGPMREKNYALVAKLADTAINKDPEFFNAYNTLAVAYTGKGKQIEAKEPTQKRAIQQFFERGAQKQETAVQLVKRKILQEGETKENLASKGNMYACLSAIYSRIGKKKEAEQYLNEARALGASLIALNTASSALYEKK